MRVQCAAHLRPKTQLEARLQSQQGALQGWQARAAQRESRADALAADLQASVVKLERAEQALREANVLSAERAASYEAPGNVRRLSQSSSSEQPYLNGVVQRWEGARSIRR